ncbi:head decoration protein [Paraburkholderia sp. Ac-20342]|uniref:head decoration protein n=1 Tax=Paraburkholderia sp. Ac-20342 TaxID=2703889 RepID=UPI00197E07B3|nr:head decoration protein [Paraburkholderia sp. Ac-20342]MBN3848362.1 head decoration protein [Paraburkholderia sp. Ac-20342]
MPTLLTENRHAGGFLVSEARGHRSRDAVTMGGATTIYAGTVLGVVLGGVAVAWPGNAAQENTNTGNGTIATAGTPVVTGAQLGMYSAIATDATHFAVTDPYGNSLGTATAGSAFSNQIAFTITAGGTAFVAGDEFSIEVEAIGAVYVPLNPSASDGSQNAAAISFGFVDATPGDAPGTVIAREAEVNASELVWPTGITAAQTSTALAQLLSNEIVAR